MGHGWCRTWKASVWQMEAPFPGGCIPAGGPAEPDYGGRCFDDQAALDAAASDGPWFPTPDEAAAHVVDATTPDDPPTRRSHR